MEQVSSDKRPPGFTLLELVVSVTILAVFLLPMMLVITNAKVITVDKNFSIKEGIAVKDD